MPKRCKTTELTCGLCGTKFEDEVKALAHKLVAHGPLGAASPQKRRRVRAKLPRLHRRLEQVGFGEAEAHLIVGVVAEEFRKEGMV